MQLLLAFSPFLVFFLVARIVGGTAGLVAAAAASAMLLARDAMTRGRSAKVLEIGTFLVFSSLALYSLLVKVAWSIGAVRLRVDLGLLLIVLVSLAIRKPFTLQYAREQVPQELWAEPGFIRTNYVITAVWAAAFVVLIAADLLLVYEPGLRHIVPIVVTIAALWGAAKFTAWYPTRRQRSLPAEDSPAVSPEE